jgi:hypothetical protein
MLKLIVGQEGNALNQNYFKIHLIRRNQHNFPNQERGCYLLFVAEEVGAPLCNKKEEEKKNKTKKK